MAEFPETEITAVKYGFVIPVSQQLLDDCRFDVDAVLNPNRRQRIQQRLRRLRTKFAERAYRVVAGHGLPEPEPDWDD